MNGPIFYIPFQKKIECSFMYFMPFCYHLQYVQLTIPFDMSSFGGVIIANGWFFLAFISLGITPHDRVPLKLKGDMFRCEVATLETTRANRSNNFMNAAVNIYSSLTDIMLLYLCHMLI